MSNSLSSTRSCLAACSLLFAFTGACSAANDNLIDALILDLNGRVSIDTTGYGREPGEPGTGNQNNRTAWFVWTAPLGGPATVRFSTYGSNYDTVITLWKRDPNNLTPQVTALLPVTGAPENPVLVDDDANINMAQGYVTWTPQASTTYYISVGRNNTGQGNSSLEATFGAVTAADALTPVIPNDNIASALEIVATITSPTTQVLRGAPVPGTTIGATTETGESTIPGNATAPRGGTVWYRYRVGAVGEVFSIAVSDFDRDAIGQVILQGFRNNIVGTPAFTDLLFVEEDLNSSIVGTPRLVINGAANTEYYFRVTSTDGDGVLFNVRLDFNPLAPTNDLVAGAISLGAVLPVVRNQGDDIYSATQTDPTNFDGNTSGANVWFSWTSPANGLVRIRSIAPTSTATTGNYHPVGSTFKYDCQVYFDTSAPKDTMFDTTTAQSVGGFNENNTAQERVFYAIKDVVYFIEIGGDDNINFAGRGFYGFTIEDAHITEVARTGVSYGPEGVLKVIGTPVVNRTGDVAFSSTFELGGPISTRNDAGLFLFNGASTRVSVIKGQQEYGTSLDIDGDGINDDKVVFGTFANLFLADRSAANDTNPDLGFTAGLTGTSDDEPVTKTNNLGFYHDDPNSAGVREMRLTDYLNDSFTWNFGGGFLGAFNTPVREGGDNTALVTGRMTGIPVVRDTGLFASTRNVVIQEEDPAPNTSEGVEFGDITGTATVNAANAMAFRAVLRGSGVTASNDTAVYTVADYAADPTALNYRLRLREGSAVAGPGGLPLAGGATIASLGEPRVNGKGRIAVTANFSSGSGSPSTTTANDSAVVSDLISPDLSFAIVVREGDSARDADGVPIANVKFVSFTAPVLITNNAVIFSARISGTGVSKTNDMGIWLWDGTTVYLVAREGDIAPGIVGTSVKFNVLGAALANPSGRLAFTATLTGTGVTTTNDAGLWTIEEDGLTPVLRLRKGDVYEFGRVELPIRRTIASIAVATGSGGDDGYVRGIDQDGNVAVVVSLKKGSAASGQAVLKLAP